MNKKDTIKHIKVKTAKEATILAIKHNLTVKEASEQTGYQIKTLQNVAGKLKISFAWGGFGRPKYLNDKQFKPDYKRVGEHKKVRLYKDVEDEWGTETADPSNLTEEQLLMCKRTGVKPERMAWLLLCPKIVVTRKESKNMSTKYHDDIRRGLRTLGSAILRKGVQS
jgi:hypothetical protein